MQVGFIPESARGRILTLPPGVSPSPRQRRAGRGLGRGAQTRWQTRAAVASRRDGLLSPALSSKGGEGDRVVGWWQCQDAPSARARPSFYTVAIWISLTPALAAAPGAHAHFEPGSQLSSRKGSPIIVLFSAVIQQSEKQKSTGQKLTN